MRRPKRSRPKRAAAFGLTFCGLGVQERTAESGRNKTEERNKALWVLKLPRDRCHQNDLPLHAYLFIVLKLRAQWARRFFNSVTNVIQNFRFA